MRISHVVQQSLLTSIWAQMEVALDRLDDAAADVGEEDGEIGIGAKSGVMVTRCPLVSLR